MLPESLTIGVIQFKPEWGDVQKNLSLTSKLLEEAGRKECEVVVLPEMWPTGMYGNFDMHKLKQPIPGPYTDFLAETAREHAFYVVAGMPERGQRDEMHNASVLISDKGEILAKHRKIHVYTPLGEDKVWTAGNDFTVVDTPIGRIGLLICYDGDFPESWRANALMGAELVFHISAYESPCENWWERFYPAAVMQNLLWAVLCNNVGDTIADGKPVHCFGRSRIIAPDGEIEAEAPTVLKGERGESYLLVKKVNAEARLEEARGRLRSLVVDRKPGSYGILAKH